MTSTMKSDPDRSMVSTSASAGGSDSTIGGGNGRDARSSTGCAFSASAGAASVAAPATTLFKKSRRPAGNFLDFAMRYVSAAVLKLS